MAALQARKGESKCLGGKLDLSPEAMSGGTLRGTVSNSKQKTDTIFFARLVPNSDHEVDVNSMLVFGIPPLTRYESRMETITS